MEHMYIYTIGVVEMWRYCVQYNKKGLYVCRVLEHENRKYILVPLSHHDLLVIVVDV